MMLEPQHQLPLLLLRLETQVSCTPAPTCAGRQLASRDTVAVPNLHGASPEFTVLRIQGCGVRGRSQHVWRSFLDPSLRTVSIPGYMEGTDGQKYIQYLLIEDSMSSTPIKSKRPAPMKEPETEKTDRKSSA